MTTKDVINEFIFEIYEDWVKRGSIEGKEITFIERDKIGREGISYENSLIRKILNYIVRNDVGSGIGCLMDQTIDTPILHLQFTKIVDGYLQVIVTNKIKNKSYEPTMESRQG